MDTKQSQTQDVCFEVRATALLPAFTSVKGFHYHPRTLTTVYRRPEHRAPPITITSTKEVSPQEQEEEQATKVITTRSLNSLQYLTLLQLSYRMSKGILALRSVVRKTQL